MIKLKEANIVLLHLEKTELEKKICLPGSTTPKYGVMKK
jgi:hypothetical protein